MTTIPIIVIPARMASSRFPNKPLVKIKNYSMIERVWRIAQALPDPKSVYIATDSDALAKHVNAFGANVIMTSSTCKTGTDRVAEAAEKLKLDDEIIFSLQGDAVLTPPWVIQAVLEEMQRDQSIILATPAVKLRHKDKNEFLEFKKKGSSTGTTVVFDKYCNALYFSKSVIPYARLALSDYPIYRHIGLYAYRASTLKKLCSLPMGVFEQIEQLEQLRALENGIPIKVVMVDYLGRTHGSVDNPEDVSIIEKIIEKEGELVL